MKIRPVGAELFHADRRTYMTKLIVAFRNFAKAPKNTLPPGKEANQLKSFNEVVLSSVHYRKPTSALCGQRKNSLQS